MSANYRSVIYRTNRGNCLKLDSLNVKRDIYVVKTLEGLPGEITQNQNRNFGSESTLSSSLAYKGADTLTVTDGSDIAQFYMNESGRLFASVDFVIPKNKTIAIKLDLNISSTTTAYAALIGHQEEIV